MVSVSIESMTILAISVRSNGNTNSDNTHIVMYVMSMVIRPTGLIIFAIVSGFILSNCHI